MKRIDNMSPQVSYLLSFLAILVHKAGGTLTIENLSSYSSSSMQLGMKLESDKDKVTLYIKKKSL